MRFGRISADRHSIDEIVDMVIEVIQLKRGKEKELTEPSSPAK